MGEMHYLEEITHLLPVSFIDYSEHKISTPNYEICVLITGPKFLMVPLETTGRLGCLTLSINACGE